jgi:hypothetical protein
MGKKLIGLAFSIAALVMGASAQTVTGSGTTNTVPVFTGASTVGNSPISVSGSNVGIGTTSPATVLDINGGEGTPASSGAMNTGVILSRSSSGVAMNIGVVDTNNVQTGYGWLSTAYANSANVNENFSLQPNGGNVGIGVTNPQTIMQVGNLSSGTSESTNHGLIQIQGNADLNSGTNGIEFKSSISGSGFGWKIFSADRANSNTPLSFAYRASSGTWLELLTMRTDNGNVGIGTTSPGATLEVNGTAKVDSTLQVSSNGIVFPSSSTPQTTPWTGVLCGGDYAEAVKAAGKKQTYEPGDVLVLTSDSNSDVRKSSKPYSTMVAGIYATKPGVIGQRQSLKDVPNQVPMAMVGIVPTKVTSENGAIHRGDLLVSSSIPGYAMKGTDRGRMLGAVIGKAMGSLDSGQGIIEVLVTLQ